MLWLAAPGPSMQKHFTEGKVSYNSQQRPPNGARFGLKSGFSIRDAMYINDMLMFFMSLTELPKQNGRRQSHKNLIFSFKP